jgi:hypothetical protein
MNHKRFRPYNTFEYVARLYRAIQQSRILRFVSACFLGLLLVVFTATAVYANIAITTTTNVAALQTALQGNNVTVSNVTVSQGSTTGQVGTFVGGLAGGAGPVIGINDGVVMVTGTATSALGPNNNSSITTGGETGPTDTNLATVDSGAQFDTASLSFNVVPAGNFMALDYVFGSDEYNEFVCTIFNDAMGIFVSGPGIAGTSNIARLSTNLSPMSVNEINRGQVGAASTGGSVAPCNLTNAAFYVKNIGDSTAESVSTPNSSLGTATSSAFTNLQYDGFTVPLTSQVRVTPGSTYTVKVVIADIGDSAWDSGLFLDGVRSFNLDLGDAPNSYGTQPIDQTIQMPGPASHSTGQDIYLGAVAPDAENTVTPATSPNAANADDSAGVDDEDAFSGDLSFVPGITTHSLSNIPVRNGTGSTAKLMGWIDFNKDGDFLDAGEVATVNVAPSQTTANLSWSGFTAPTTGTSYARFRITTDPNITNSPTPLGLAGDGEVEDYRVLISAASISGTVFEDPNYGGGAGRPLATASTSPRDGATVELYKSDGTYISNTTTAGGGKYTFANLAPGDYKVRVVNSTVSSSRPNPTGATGLVAVQTFRTDAGVTAGTVTAVTDYVGGEKPAEVDAPANTTATLTTLNGVANQEVQSLTTVKIGGSNISGIDFGYNFDTVVNTNDSGQGSLRQFIINSNALANTGLTQSGLTAGTETSIFMISDGVVHSGLRSGLTNQLTTYGAAKINLMSILPTITDAYTAIDGRTQTNNVGNTNTSVLGDTATLIGVGGTPLAGVSGPEIELAGDSTTQNNLIWTSGNNTTFRSLAISAKSTGSVAGTGSTIRILAGADSTEVLESAIGVAAANDGAPGTGYYAAILTEANSVLIDKNLLRGRGETVFSTGSITGWKITNNEISTSIVGSNSGNATVNFSNGANTLGPQNPLIQRNYLHNGRWGIQADGSNSVGAQFLDNTIQNNTVSGVLINFTEKNHTIARNIITSNGSGGVVIERDVTGVTISQNSIYANTGPGIDLSTNQASYVSQGLSPNDGLINGMTGATSSGNTGIDYPVITSSVLNSGTLTVKGFVGDNPAGSTTFANTTLEFFIADNTPADQNGAVILGDGKSQPHGEGKTYIGTCTADSNGLFGTVAAPCAVNNAVTATLMDANNITATATDAAGNTSEFSPQATTGASILLVKRITAINGFSTNPNDGTVLNAFVDDITSPAAANDNNSNWPSNYLRGAIDGGKVKKDDEVEYTIYFLNAGGRNAKTARICDAIKSSQNFQVDKYATGQGIRLTLGNSTDAFLTNSNDPATDRGQYIAGSSAVSANCNIPTNSVTNGVVIVDLAGSTGSPSLTSLPYATGAGSPNNSYGFIRFTTKVGP